MGWTHERNFVLFNLLVTTFQILTQEGVDCSGTVGNIIDEVESAYNWSGSLLG